MHALTNSNVLYGKCIPRMSVRTFVFARPYHVRTAYDWLSWSPNLPAPLEILKFLFCSLGTYYDYVYAIRLLVEIRNEMRH